MSIFQFKQFSIQQDKCAMKIGTDGVLLGAWANIVQASSILDIGTGTGVLALMSAQRNATTHIHAIEIEEQAFSQAHQNIQQSPWANRIQCFNQSVQDFTHQKLNTGYDSIICNPPYFDINASTHIQDKARNIARNSSALTFEVLLDCMKQLLTPMGNISVILPTQEGNQFVSLAEERGFYLKRLTAVMPRVGKKANRLLIELVSFSCLTEENSLAIRKQGKGQQDFTPAYTLLHQDFYLRF